MSRFPIQIDEATIFRWFSGLMIITVMSVVTARMIDSSPLQSANDRSRWCTVWSLVERGTYQIDEIRQRPDWGTIDMVRHDGHFYSSKPPLLPRIVAEMYRCVKAVTGWNLLDHTREVTATLLFLINILPMGLALWAFSGLVWKSCHQAWGRLFVVTAACWGTLLLPFLTVFNNHTIAGWCFYFSLVLAAGIVSGEQTGRWRFAACGLLTAFGVCNELPAALLGLGMFFLLWRQSTRLTWGWFVPGALVPLVLFFVTNYEATGSWKPFYMSYGTETYNFVHEGVPSYWMEPRGIDRAIDSTGTYLWHCLFGHHGIFSLTPIWLLTLATWFRPRWWKNTDFIPKQAGTAPVDEQTGRSRLGIFHAGSAVLSLLVLCFYLTKTENYNYGGVSVALRWTLWLTPFWLFSAIPAINAWSGKRLFRWCSALLLAVSVFSAWYPSRGPWSQPWLFEWMTERGWIDYRDPPSRFDPPRQTWIGKLPTGEVTGPTAEFLSNDFPGARESLRLIDGGGNGSERIVRIERIDRAGETRRDGYRIDVRKFDAGAGVKEFLLGRDDGFPVTEADRELFTGIPESKAYYSSGIRYIKTSLRTDAFRCHIGSVWSDIETPQGTRRLVRTVWFCDEMPFGVLKWEDRILERPGNAILLRRFWDATVLPPTPAQN